MDPERWRRIEELFAKAVELPPDETARFLDGACNGDTALRREVALLLESDHAAPAGLRAAVREAAVVFQQSLQRSSPVYVGRRVGPYEIVREIGSGGMGAVYHAVRVDDQYLRSVAIKFIAQSANSAEAHVRFRTERQILATLQHPNIASLLDGGTTEDGLPYIVLEYIEGEPLLDYCRSHDLNVRQRLELFCSLCSAVHHAHQMLVIHRDIKPGNVLVTSDGVAKLLDFGIAKLIARELIPEAAATTQAHMRRLTPQYASPEQIRGENLTTATDIYSLGVLLYELLTFESPYRVANRTSQEIERAVCNSEPLRLSAVVRADARLRRQLAGDLENIVAMSLRKEPQRRYPSAQQFADDIQRYLKGMPVSARQETPLYLATKLVRRNKVAAGAFALLLLSIGAGWYATYREAKRTEARFQEVRKLANVVLYDFHRQIAPLPGSTPARELLVRTGLEYLNSLSKDGASDPSLRWEISQAYEQVGDAQGDPAGPSLGQYREALKSYAKSMEMVEEVSKKRRDYQVLSCLTWLHYKRGDLEARIVSTEAALASYQRGLTIAGEIASKMKDGRPDDLLRNGYLRVTSAELRMGNIASSLESAKLAKLAAERALQRRASPAARANLANAQGVLGNVLWLTGDMNGAWVHCQGAVRELEGIVKAQEGNYELLPELEEAYRRAGDLQGNSAYFHFGNTDLAREYHSKALEIARKVAAQDPRNALAQSHLSIALRRMGVVSQTSNPAAAIAYYKQSIEILGRLLKTSPGDLSFYRDLGNARLGLAGAYRGAHRYAAATQELETAIASQKELIRRSPERLVVREDMFDSLLALGDVKLDQGDPEAASLYLDEALATARFLMERNNDSLYSERCLALISAKMGDLFALRRQPTEALAWYDKSLAIWTRWRDRNIAVPYSTNRAKEVAQARSQLRAL